MLRLAISMHGSRESHYGHIHPPLPLRGPRSQPANSPAAPIHHRVELGTPSLQ